ncbi:MAG: UDP-N-acetylglucosamine--N-acetylmuramyl-(pentapeptide) pyrophosphoryl-undecaprenol N-acetylglucosamine transferase [Chloroflexaceae bacterium]|nr:UDP-N-acetylglucosamine--N-acetylmuramyl-(pentapeptide) pyrophosphoryl-undecaprenol N-acetylglucosamine transferase [Chloroflexaceae bacterium]
MPRVPVYPSHAHPRSPHWPGPSGSRLRYCLSGGGTGGHVYPALAVAAALQRGAEEPEAATSQPDCGVPVDDEDRHNDNDVAPLPDVVYVGSRGGMEQRIVQSESNLTYRAIPTAALRGQSNPLTVARNGVLLATGTVVAWSLLRELRPDALLGTGGYVCAPLFLAARLLNIPTLLYLPDIVPGLAVRWLSRIATQVACSVEDSCATLARHGSLPPLATGYPVRDELFRQDRVACRAAFGMPEGDNLPVLLVYGGSRGARSINRVVETLLPDILNLAHVIHLCGREGDETWLRAAAAQLDAPQQARYRIFPYLENQPTPSAPATMVQALGAADLALCRSGASTLGELPALGLPAILVPYPYVHQDENADYLVRHGAAIKIADAEMGGDGPPQDGPLFAQVSRLLKTHPHERFRMAERSRALARPDAAKHLADALRNLVGRREGSCSKFNSTVGC